MKRYLIFIFIFFNQILYSQNLVKNGGLEDLTGDCDYCWPAYWHTYAIQSNCGNLIYNNCNTDFISACPHGIDLFYSPQPFEGNGYADFQTFSYIGQFVRGFISGELSSALKQDTVYEISFAIRLQQHSFYLSQKLHIIFHDELIHFGECHEEHNFDGVSFIEIDNIAHDYKDIIKKQWVVLKGFYKAKGGEKYITFGNIDYSMESAIYLPGELDLYPDSYFFIDDVQLQVSKALLCDLERGNAITPNGDGLNDVFEVKALYSKTSLYIFNRWGNMIYETNDYRNDWDAKDHPAGVYYYIFRRPNGDECRGVVSVIKDN